MATTIKDIAKVSGYGIGTVSRVLNGSPSVKPETRDKILKIVQRLHYKPNKMAKMLVTGNYTDSTIGILLPRITHRFSQEIIAGIYSRLGELGYNLIIFNIGRQREEVFRRIMYADFSGLLVLTHSLSPEEKTELKNHRSQFIYLDYHEDTENSIYFDNRSGGGLAAQYLLSNNCRSIAFIGDLKESQQRQERYEGFKGRLEQEGSEIEMETDIQMDEDAAYRVTMDIIKKGNIDGIYYYCDVLALGGLKAKLETGSDIRIIGYDDIHTAGYVSLSTVRQPADKLGEIGATRIVELIEREREYKENNVISDCIEPELIDRGS